MVIAIVVGVLTSWVYKQRRWRKDIKSKDQTLLASLRSHGFLTNALRREFHVFRNLRTNLMLVSIRKGPIPVHCFHLAQQPKPVVKFASGFFNLGNYLKLIYFEVK